MRDFLDDLDRQLAAMAAEQAELDAPQAAPAKAEVRRRRPAVLGGLTATIAAGLAGFALVGTSAADLPILSSPTVDASAIADRAPAAAKMGVDFSKGHVFGTPNGPGYVVVNKARGTVCLLAPSPDEPGSYGVACGTPLATVERDGLYSEFVGDQSVTRNATTTAVFVMPDGTRDVRLVSGGRTTRPALESGVLVTTVREDSRLTWTVGGRSFSRVIRGPFEGTFGESKLSCPDGSSVTVKLPPTKPGEAPPRIDKLIAKVCGTR